MSTNNFGRIRREFYYSNAKSKAEVYNLGPRIRHFCEKEASKFNNRETRRERIKLERIKTKRATKAKVMGTDAVEKTVVKGLLPKGPEISKDIAMLDAFWDTSSQFFKTYVSATVPKVTQSLKTLSSEWWTKFAKHPKLSFAAMGVIGSVAAVNLIRGSVANKEQRSAIPREYERGYDLINEYTSNFGSPVKASVVTRALVPYVSSVRRAIVKNIDGIMKSNPALVSANNAIGHTRY
jgi:hypothetical protein